MAKYEYARVYFIKNFDNNKYYIGSTTEKYLSKRINQHKGYLTNKNVCTSKEVFETDNYYYDIIYDCACNNINDLRSLEYQAIEEYIKEGKNVVNRHKHKIQYHKNLK